MDIIERKRIRTDVLTDVLCDCCGKSCKIDCKIENVYEYASLQARWGYYSSMDGEEWNDVFCEKCAIKIRDYAIGLGLRSESADSDI